MNQQPMFESAKPTDRILGGLISGAIYPLRALWLLIKTPRLRNYVLMPILVNLLVGITVYAGLLFLGFKAIDALLAGVPNWSAEVSHDFSGLATNMPQTIHLPDWHLSLPTWFPNISNWHLNLPVWNISLPDWLLNWNIHLPSWVTSLPGWAFTGAILLLRFLLIGVLFLITGFVFLQFGVLLGAPWYGKLSEETEKLQTGQVFIIEVNPVVEISRAVLYEIKKLILAIGIGFLLLLCNVFLGPGTAISVLGGLVLASTIACMDFLDAAVERHRPRFRQKLGIVFRSLPASASFGLVCLGLVSIPLVNLLAIPVCVSAGTLFFCDRVLPWLQPSGKINRNV